MDKCRQPGGNGELNLLRSVNSKADFWVCLFYEHVHYFKGEENIVPGLICLIGEVSYILEECDGYKP